MRFWQKTVAPDSTPAIHSDCSFCFAWRRHRVSVFVLVSVFDLMNIIYVCLPFVQAKNAYESREFCADDCWKLVRARNPLAYAYGNYLHVRILSLCICNLLSLILRVLCAQDFHISVCMACGGRCEPKEVRTLSLSVGPGVYCDSERCLLLQNHKAIIIIINYHYRCRAAEISFIQRWIWLFRNREKRATRR